MIVKRVRMHAKSFVLSNAFVCMDRVLVNNCYQEVPREYLVTTKYFVSLIEEAQKVQLMIQ